MHNWGDERVDWKGINDAAEFIGTSLVKYGLMNVRDWKEKYGTVRVYVDFGWYSIHSITHPRHAFIRYRRDSILWKLNYSRSFNRVFQLVNYIVVPYHKWLYRYMYRKAIEKWPHLRAEILEGADDFELLKGL